MVTTECEIRISRFSARVPDNPALAEREIHVIRADLTASPRAVSRFSQILSADERERASRFHFERHRRRCIVGRGLLRSILGFYVRVDPASLKFNYGLNGKPGLDAAWGHDHVAFNVSHTEELALYAVTLGAPIGVDVERVSAQPDLDGIARSFFSSVECTAYFQLPPEERTQAFFRCWTRKEAFIKAIGDGLSYPLDRFDVSIEHGGARLLSVDGDPKRAFEWSIYHLNPGEGYIGALAIKGRGFKIRSFHYHTSD